jgi:hypothetical protein
VSLPGDLWLLGNHRVNCGSALDPLAYRLLMDSWAVTVTAHEFESPQLHQEVRASRHDFLRLRVARHFRSLPRRGPDHPGARNSWATKAAEALFHLVEPRRRRKTKEDTAKDHDPLNAWRCPFEEARKQEPLFGGLHDWYVESVRSAIAEDEPSAEASLS